MIDVITTNEPNINNRARMMSLFGVHHTSKAIEADTVVVSVGYKSNQTLYDSIKGENVYLLGDAIQPGNLMTAIWGAYCLVFFYQKNTNNGLEIFIDAVNQNLHDLLPLDLELSNEGLKNGFKKGQFLEIEPMLLIFYHD